MDAIEYYRLAATFLADGHPTAALGAARRAVTENPNVLRAQLLLATLCERAGYAQDAIAALAAAHALAPRDVAILRRLADALRRGGREKESVIAADVAAGIDPESPATFLCLGDALLAVGEPVAADRMYCRALAADPQLALAECGRGAVHLAGAQWEAAHAAFGRALELDPGCAEARYNRALLDIRFGEYGAGFAAYPAIMETAEQRARYHYYYEGVPLWDGSALGGRRLVVAYEQGLGSQIVMARFFKKLPPFGASIAIETPPAMLPLLRRNFPELTFTAFTHWQPLDIMDVHLPLMQLPGLLRVAHAADLAAGAPYLTADPVRVEVLRKRLRIEAGTRNVGIVWHGNRESSRDRWRIAPLSAWRPFTSALGTRFHSLQFGATPDELAGAPLALEPAHEVIRDMDDTAALIALMDLVVSVDTSVVHLAAALGRPTWMPLSVRGDYRWGVDQADSPWYPTLRIFRQNTLDDWQPVFREIAAAFEAFDGRSSKAAP